MDRLHTELTDERGGALGSEGHLDTLLFGEEVLSCDGTACGFGNLHAHRN